MTSRPETSAELPTPTEVGADGDQTLGHLRVGGVFDVWGQGPHADGAVTPLRPVRPRPLRALRVLVGALRSDGTVSNPQTDGVPNLGA